MTTTGQPPGGFGPPRTPHGAPPGAARQALDGVRVVELGWAAAGPLVGTYLASHGADVIHVESSTALDPFRSTYPPFKDNMVGPDRAGMFAFYNAGKRGVTLDLKQPRGVELALRLVRMADVVIESFPAGTLARRGLGHDALRRARPDLVLLSSCNQGQTGPHAQHPGYGSQLTALAGFNELLGEPDRTPVILYGPYIDYIAVGYGVIAILAALERRRRTGEGCVIDLSQYEAGLQFLTPALLEHAANGAAPTRAANHDHVAVPHGVYPSEGDDRWVALSVWSDDEWTLFRAALGDPDWARDGSLATADGRRAREADLDARIAQWTRTRTREETVAALRARGLRAAPVESIGELFEDDQLAHRGVWRRAPHAGLGDVGLMAPPFALSETPARPDRAGPTLGEHNEAVFKGLLGLSADEYASLAADGVFA
jgi:benzylsuccinate CoA-transferase BbsF subunit